jgi:hypothetical protein
MIQLLCIYIYTPMRTKISQQQPPVEKSGNQVAGKQLAHCFAAPRGERGIRRDREREELDGNL